MIEFIGLSGKTSLSRVIESDVLKPSSSSTVEEIK